ncbi:hypothetical protein [Xanthomonas theicola]|uniref:hypothetical protein n=1 Tax=Xanthomonas theicola TaxID=56464 RepID=UPI001FE31F83|nr:hypothetical protein [Xanthomonas theicola]
MAAALALRRVAPELPGTPRRRARSYAHRPVLPGRRRHALLHRDLAHALASNPLPVAALPLLAVVMVRNAAGPRPPAPLL